MPETLRFHRRNLPHWIVADRTYFVTLRLHGTLPREVIEEFRKELRVLEDRRSGPEDMLQAHRRQFVRIERILDACSPDRAWLTTPDVASLLLDNLAWLQGEPQGWRVRAAVVMSNHMHLLLRNDAGKTACLEEHLAQYKGFTGREANKRLSRRGAFWAREQFDHWCRTPEKVEAAVVYIQQNPVVAGLCGHWRDWPWTRVEEDSGKAAAGS